MPLQTGNDIGMLFSRGATTQPQRRTPNPSTDAVDTPLVTDAKRRIVLKRELHHVGFKFNGEPTMGVCLDGTEPTEYLEELFTKAQSKPPHR